VTTATRRCCGCKERFKADSMISLPVGFFHSVDCSIQYANKKTAVKSKKVHAKQKSDFYANDVKTRKKAAKDACHSYIRMRDREQSCICCGETLGNDFQAGHWLPSGSNTKIRYHEDNIHAQRLNCNYFKGGDSGDYKDNLIDKIGSERVKYLLENKGGTLKRTASDYKEIESHYKNKLKEIESAQQNIKS